MQIKKDGKVELHRRISHHKNVSDSSRAQGTSTLPTHAAPPAASGLAHLH